MYVRHIEEEECSCNIQERRSGGGLCTCDMVDLFHFRSRATFLGLNSPTSGSSS